MLSRKLLSILFLLIIFLEFRCKEKPTELVKDDPEVTLNYQWSVDTLYYNPLPDVNGDTMIRDMWGSSDSSVFACGFDATGGGGALWNFNGQKWNRIKLFTFEGGTFTQSLSLNGFMGFSGNNIYAFGDHIFSNPKPPPNLISSGMAIQFDGTNWKELSIPKGVTMYTGAAYSANNFYAGGSDGQMYHYNDGAWSLDTIKQSFFPNLPYYDVIPISCSDEGVYAITSQYNQNDGIIYYQTLLLNGKNVSFIDSTTVITQKWGGISYWRSPSGKIFSAGKNGIYQLLNNQWNIFYSSENILCVNGNDDNRIFALANSGNVYFYNGKNWKMIKKIDLAYPVNGKVWCTQNEVFISVYQNFRTLIYHGKEKTNVAR